MNIEQHAARVLQLQQQIAEAEAAQRERAAAHVEQHKSGPPSGPLISPEIIAGRAAIMQLQQRLQRARLDHERAVARAEAAYLADPKSYTPHDRT
jgi:small-conductance mechanosensitive channel